MDEQTMRLEHLETQVQRLQRTVKVLAVGLIALLGAFAIGAAQEQPQELTLRKLTIVDAEGKARIVAAAYPDGSAAIHHSDGDGKMRIGEGTTLDGQSSTEHYGRDGKTRIHAMTRPNGKASIQHLDRDGKQRIMAGTAADGSAVIAVVDRTGNAAWVEASE